MDIPWANLIDKALEMGRKEMVDFIQKHRGYLESHPEIAIRIITSKQKLPDERLWATTLSKMTREERDEHNKQLVEDAAAIGEYLNALFKNSKILSEAFWTIGHVARQLLAIIFDQIKDLLEDAAKNQQG